MTTQYTTIIIMTILTLCVLMILIHANGRLTKKEKNGFAAICIMIALAAAAEWLAVLLDGAPMWTYKLHLVAKCLDYSLTPLCCLPFVRQLSKNVRLIRLVTAILCANILFEIASIFTGWAYYLDGQNIHRHGSLYFLYIVVFIASAVFVVAAFLEYGRRYENKNRGPLFAIIALLAASILLQEYFGGEVRTVYLGMAVCISMLYIHYIEFAQIDQDRTVTEKDAQLSHDALTGVQSRFAYMQTLAKYPDGASLPQSLAAFETDLNGLKTVNDTLGHEAGDILLRGAGAVLMKVIGDKGSVFRTGGDEFVILLDTARMAAEEAERQIRMEAEKWSPAEQMRAGEQQAKQEAQKTMELSFSIGYACTAELPELDLLQLVHEADQRMYEDKERYYRMPEHERRRRY